MLIDHDSTSSLLKFRRRIGASKWYHLFKRVFSLFFPLCLIGGIGYLLMNLNLFFVQNIEVLAFGDDILKYTESDEVQDLLIDYVGQRLFSINIIEVQNIVKNDFNFVSEVYVTKRFPNSLVVRIVEREPAIIISLLDNENNNQEDISENVEHKYIVDTNGKVLDSCDDWSFLCNNLPECGVSLSSGDIIIGEVPLVLELDSVLQIVLGIKNIGLVAKNNSIPKSHVIIVELDDTTRIIFSTKSDINEQLNIFEYTRENLLLQGKTYKEIDLRFDRPVVRVDKYTDWMTE